MTNDQTKLDKIVALCKRRGFVFQGSEIYGGLSGTWDYGPYGAELAHNIKDSWWNFFVRDREDIYGMQSSTIMPESVWRASGHLEGFTDLLVECKKCKHRFRADHLDNKEKCPDCDGELGEEKVFNLMFSVETGSTSGEATRAYLRGELAQGMFVNFRNVLDTMHPNLPFGLAQIGKAYRNEISPRDFLFRVREFDLMEFEYFVREGEWEKHFEFWKDEMWKWIDLVGIDRTLVHELEVPKEDRAHYSKRTVDFEFDYPFGRKELYGLAYRTDDDLENHIKGSKKELSFITADGEKITPHVVEPTFGHGRTMLAILLSAYKEDEINGEKRTYLALNYDMAPVKVAVFPLLKNKPELVEKAREVYKMIKEEIPSVEFDDNGNIGKRYRRQDEIGTPYCVTIDFDTLDTSASSGQETVTLRHRDTAHQERVKIDDLVSRVST